MISLSSFSFFSSLLLTMPAVLQEGVFAVVYSVVISWKESVAAETWPTTWIELVVMS